MKNTMIVFEKKNDEKCQTISRHSVTVPEVRDDGLMIFCDGDRALNEVRKSGTREQVILTVALRRAQEIAINYARKYAPDLLTSITHKVSAPVIGLPQEVEEQR